MLVTVFVKYQVLALIKYAERSSEVGKMNIP